MRHAGLTIFLTQAAVHTTCSGFLLVAITNHPSSISLNSPKSPASHFCSQRPRGPGSQNRSTGQQGSHQQTPGEIYDQAHLGCLQKHPVLWGRTAWQSSAVWDLSLVPASEPLCLGASSCPSSHFLVWNLTSHSTCLSSHSLCQDHETPSQTS